MRFVIRYVQDLIIQILNQAWMKHFCSAFYFVVVPLMFFLPDEPGDDISKFKEQLNVFVFNIDSSFTPTLIPVSGF